LNQIEEEVNALFNFVSRVGLLSPIILRLEGAGSLLIEGKGYQLATLLTQILQVIPCHVEGVPLPEGYLGSQVVELFAVTLLDNGALSVNFDFSIENVSETKEFLALFPRSRIGLRPLGTISDHSKLAAIFEDFKDILCMISGR
jgi:hypothetical protein